MKIYIASSWKNQHAVEMLTTQLRAAGHEVAAFVEQEGGAGHTFGSIDQWIDSDNGGKCFDFDTNGATKSDLVIYIGPSGCDAWAEVGAAWGCGVRVLGLWAKGEQAGLMRRMLHWFSHADQLLDHVQVLANWPKEKTS